MSKAVLISIQPKWCQKIASGEKTIEVRKNRPELRPPFKCYIYCTYGKGLIERYDPVYPNLLLDQTVSRNKMWGNCCNGKVIGEFICDEVYAVLAHPSVFAGHPVFYKKAIEAACLTEREVEEYSRGKDLCGWHISNLVIYDKPKRLGEFIRHDESYDIGSDGTLVYIEKLAPITRPPQNWCYVKWGAE